ncbi:thymidylate kinase, putative [Trypanosoma cruzi]|uniref:dTMP kinase n=2 Tax=Trypanosoma cruzi TaxID=5693 RepID=V5AU19_TRYCR|nr:thymidylate kinase, putative [Trypanosoma cruzi]ESS64310.1 thymidylate kinase [Trypanosoma cruzi Dm28c]PBJ68524.1 thymidylate kinase [Trypanosoma cruzi cruzi]KAF8287412.1 putative thymidylate kinase [Trypanosoma cruzi]PBJ78386.1 thymidylate kinase [Trypanosoma cruzi cruzi]
MKIVVFLDVRSEALCTAVASEAATVGDSVELVHCHNSVVQVLRRKNKQQETVNTFICLITEKGSLKDAGVVYALFRRRIAVLSLEEGSIASTSIPLLETISSLHVDLSGGLLQAQLLAVKAFFSFNASVSQVIVFEGGDGVGKATQARLLVDRLVDEGHRVSTIEFPSERNRYGELLREVLSGKKGGIQDLDPKLFSLLFSMNRFAFLPELQYWMCRGTKIVLDRYYTANCGHQASKFPEEERAGFISHLQLMEVSWLRLPPANLVLYLDLPPHAAFSAMKADPNRGSLDIHETAQRAYKENVRKTYLWCCENMSNWFHTDCCDCVGSRLSREETHNKAYEMIERQLIPIE